MVESSPASRGLAEQYSAEAEDYAVHWAPVIGPMARPLVEALASSSARDVLDLGCGTGRLIPELRAALPGARIFGVDRALGMLQVARRSDRCGLAQMDAQRLALRSAVFDVVALPFMLFHLPDPAAGLLEARRVLRTGGTLGVVVWGAGPDAPWVAIWREELDAHGAVADPRAPDVMRHDDMNTEAKLSALLREAGFARVETSVADFEHPWTVDALLAMHLRCGAPARRLSSLPPARRDACAQRVEHRLRALTADELVDRSRVVVAVARR